MTSEETKLANAVFKNKVNIRLIFISELSQINIICLNLPFFYSCDPLPVIDVVLKVEENWSSLQAKLGINVYRNEVEGSIKMFSGS